jgi:ribose/xylose/arabinose/galactoside ABC-type transport system permease subunit
MVFDDSSQAHAGSRYPGEGFRHAPDFREDTTIVGGGAETAEPMTDMDTLTLGARDRNADLDHVFDDPAEGEGGRDRVLVHGVWELLLLVALAGVAYLLYRQDGTAFGGEHLRALLLSASVLGLLAAACAVSLRAGVPNLAVGAVAVASGVYLGQHGSHGLSQAVLLVVGLCAAIGTAHGLVIVVLHVPGWAASIGVGLALLAWSARQAAVAPGYDPVPHAYYWFASFCAVSLSFGLLGLVPVLRRTLGRFRPATDPARRRGVVAALVALGATVLSTILAGVGGVLAISVSADRSFTPTAGLELTALALGAALLGGTSAYGRRGGIFGTILAVALLTVLAEYAEATHRGWGAATLAAAAIGVGLVVTRLVERFGRSVSGDAADDEEWAPTTHSARARNWQTPAPSSAVGLWASDDEWETADRRPV